MTAPSRLKPTENKNDSKYSNKYEFAMRMPTKYLIDQFNL